MACASTSRWIAKGKSLGWSPVVPSLEEEEDKPDWSLREQPEREVTGMQEGINFKQNPTLTVPCLPSLGLYPQNVS